VRDGVCGQYQLRLFATAWNTAWIVVLVDVERVLEAQLRTELQRPESRTLTADVVEEV
jgi:hypothetical protein